MFSANENIVLRQHKRRVTEFIESTIPENALELGTSVMVMQVSCRQPGCVPLETAITIIFPKPVGKKKKKMKRPTAGSSSSSSHDASTDSQDELPSFPQPLIPDLEESRIGGSFKTRILKPLAEVTLDDVLEALPPNFKISPAAKSREFRGLLDLSYNIRHKNQLLPAVNSHTTKLAPQKAMVHMGSVLRCILHSPSGTAHGRIQA